MLARRDGKDHNHGWRRAIHSTPVTEASPSLRVGALELPYCYGDVDRVTDFVDGALASALVHARGLDLVVLCEAALTGYVSHRGDFDLSRFAEPKGGPSTSAMRRIARAHGVALGFPLIELDGARRFNSYLVADASGELIAHYRKRRPWVPERWATPGDLGTPSFTIRGVKLTVAVCYDIHTVSRFAGATLDASDALIFPSSWVDDDADDLRDELLPKVARRHGIWIVNPNWGSGAPVWRGAGRSRILSPEGALIASAGEGGGASLVTATLKARAKAT